MHKFSQSSITKVTTLKTLAIILFIGVMSQGCIRPPAQGIIDDNRQDEPVALFLTWQQDPTTTMTIDWHTEPEDQALPELRYRIEGALDWRSITASQHDFPYSERIIQRVELSRLSPATTYEFQMGEFRRIYKFRTMPDRLDSPVRFATGGDTRHQYEWMLKTNKIALEYDPDFIVWGGDLAYANGDPARIYRWYDWFDAIKNGLISEDGRVVPIILVIGNHEQFYTSRLINGTYPHNDPMTQEEANAYLEKFDLYDRKVTFFYDLFAFPGKQGYNVLDFGKYMSVVLLDSDHDNPIVGDQTEWLEQVLTERIGRPHIFPVYHVPAFPSHRNYDDRRSTQIRDNWVPLFEEYGVRVAFENHDHTYKRTPPIKNEQIAHDGIVFIGDGGWGVDMDREGNNRNEWFIKSFVRERHAIIVTVHGPHQHFLVVSENGIVIDEYPATPKRH